jgi:nucleotide-binding universal stress UspA family protein/L-asparagine transporter-like permease
MEISTIGRPRNVGWVRAAALLYGDWGTSKAYVIGLAIAAVGFAALPHLLAVCAVTGLVGVNYIWVCKHFPNGGGVYTAAGLHSRRLATIGGLLLLADFIVTAALSCLDGFHYLGIVNHADAKKWAITAIFVMGAINFLGPKHAGGLAVWLSIPTLLVVVALIAGGVPHLPAIHPEPIQGSLLHNWTRFVDMILALSGVEVAASSTGVMRLDSTATPDKPMVLVTARRAILVVMVDVVLGTALLSVLAMCLPDLARNHQNDMLRFMGETFYGPRFGVVVGWVFGLLLISAVNTAITGMVALLYIMAHDGELPDPFLQLNRFGVPWVALITATVLPALVLNIDDSVEGLAALYAIGVVGAIVINLGSCAFAKSIALKAYERATMRGTFLILLAIWITIALSKPAALLFVSAILALGLTLRQVTLRHRQAAPQVRASSAASGPSPPALPPAAPFLGQFILVAARGWTPALQFALEESRVRGAQLLVLYIREVAVALDMQLNWKDDPFARDLFTRLETESKGLRVNRLYSVSDSPADTIIDIAATFGIDTVVLGGSRRAALVNLLKGNVVTRVASNLPESMHLIVIG